MDFRVLPFDTKMRICRLCILVDFQSNISSLFYLLLISTLIVDILRLNSAFIVSKSTLDLFSSTEKSHLCRSTVVSFEIWGGLLFLKQKNRNSNKAGKKCQRRAIGFTGKWQNLSSRHSQVNSVSHNPSTSFDWCRFRPLDST